MGIRRTYHFNAPGAARKDGIYINDPCDLHFRQAGIYAGAPYGLDADSSTRLQIGDKAGGRPNSASLPVEIVGGFHHGHTDISSSPYNVTADDYLLCVDSSGGNRVINLPSIASFAGKRLWIKKTAAANSVTINRAGSDTIEGTETSRVLTSLYYTVCLFAEASSNTWLYLHNDFNRKSIYYNSDIAASTTSGSYVTLLSSGSEFFSGRPVVFFVNGSMALVNGSDVLAEIGLALQIDSGSDTTIGLWTTNKANSHSGFNVTGILVPTRGSHVINLRWRRNTATGTPTLDTYDFCSIHFIEL
jgi:hypothetical protein